MSSDNYLWVRFWRGRWYIQQEFASCDPDRRRKPSGAHATSFDDRDQAILKAVALESQGYYEYGVRADPERTQS